MTRHHRLRVPVAVTAAVGIALAIAGPASAHIHTDPEQVQAGTMATVGFIVEHGCGASPTTKVEIQLPDGATDIAGVDEAGFTSKVDGQVVTFSGGSLPDGTEQAFKVTFMVPDAPGDVPVKMIQTCAEGSLEWIELQPAGSPEPEHPAPLLTITEGAATGGGEHGHDEEATTTEADHHAEEATTTEADHHAEEASTTEGDHHAEETSGTAGGDSDSDSDDGSSSAPLIAGVVAAVAVVGGGTALYLRSRKDGASGAGGASTPGDGPDPAA